jgi:hypothetical protein
LSSLDAGIAVALIVTARNTIAYGPTLLRLAMTARFNAPGLRV